MDLRDLVDELKRRGYGVVFPGVSQIAGPFLIVNGIQRTVEDAEKLLETRVAPARRIRRR